MKAAEAAATSLPAGTAQVGLHVVEPQVEAPTELHRRLKFTHARWFLLGLGIAVCVSAAVSASVSAAFNSRWCAVVIGAACAFVAAIGVRRQLDRSVGLVFVFVAVTVCVGVSSRFWLVPPLVQDVDS